MLEIGGVELLPAWPVFLSFALAGLVLNILPGADMTFIIAAAAKGGRRDGIVAALGIGTGALLHVLAAVLGLSAILASSETAFTLLKWLGAAYLLCLAVSILRAPPEPTGDDGSWQPGGPSRWALFRSAALVNVLNPKVALFFLAFLPQFVNPQAAVPALQILCLGLWFDFAGTLVNCAIATGAAGAAAKLRSIGWLARAARALAATMLGALAVQLALASRR